MDCLQSCIMHETLTVIMHETLPLTLCSTSLLQDFFVKNIGKLYAYEFLALLLKFYWLTFKPISSL